MSVFTPNGIVQTKQLVAAAWLYASRGIPVFPCNPSTKAPLTSNGFKDATCDHATIDGWWQNWPDAMIGVPTGKASGFDVLDIDVKHHNGFESVPAWRQRSPVIVHTPSGGVHLWFKSSGLVRTTTGQIGPGVDTRGAGGYVIVPASEGIRGASLNPRQVSGAAAVKN